jgi:hypothetical protein
MPAEDLPDWLINADTTGAAGGANDETQIAPPNWLVGAEPPASVSPPPSPPAPLMPASPPGPPADDIPAWLRNMPAQDLAQFDAPQPASNETDLSVTPFSFDEGSQPASASDLPGWLMKEPTEPPRVPGEATNWLAASASQLVRASQPPTPDDAIPSWLRDIAPEPTPATPPTFAAPAASAEQLPSWLQEIEPAAPTPSAPIGGVTKSDTDLPSWLRDAEPSSSAEQDPTLSAEEPHVPSWLIEAETAQPGQPNLPAVEVPSWLKEEESLPSAAAQGSAESLPSWLQESDPVAPSAPTDGDVPEWLRGDMPSAAPVEGGADVPSWLQDPLPTMPPPTPVPIPVASAAPALPTAPGAPEDLPAWLRDAANEQAEVAPAPNIPDSLPPWLRDEQGDPLPTAVAPSDANLPAWLHGVEQALPTPAAVPTPAAPPASGAPNLDWFGDMEASTTPSQPSGEASEGGILGGADLPAWLRRETEKPRDTAPADARSLDWLARIGSYDDAPAAESPVQSLRLSLPPLPTMTPAQLDALGLLKRIVAEPLPIATPLPPAEAVTPFQRIGLERLASVILLVVVIIGLILPGVPAMIPPPTPSPSVAALVDQIQQLQSDDIVLIGYEWNAQRISELRPLEQAVIGELIRRKVTVVLVSTDPQGTLLQYDLLDQLNRSGYTGGNGVDYLLLGYRPGGEIGLRQIAQNLTLAFQRDFLGQDARVSAIAQRANTINDFAMMIVLGDEPSDMQGWMEQVRPSYPGSMAFLIPSGVKPVSQPYFTQPKTYVLAGTAEAQAFVQQIGGPDTGAFARQAAALRFATLSLVGVMLLGLLIAFAIDLSARRKAQS